MIQKLKKILLSIFIVIGCIQCDTFNKTDEKELAILSFNILQCGFDASNVGFPNSRFGGSRIDDIANVILKLNPDIVGIQEDSETDSLLNALGKGWNRCHNIYSKYKMKDIASSGNLIHLCRIYLPSGDSLLFLNTHWWPMGGGPEYIKDKLRKGVNPYKDIKAFSDEVVRNTNYGAEGPRGYNATVALIRPYLEAEEKVIVVGDFNEPSHLDWTKKYAENGPDRWLNNPTDYPVNFAVEWPGSKLLESIGLKDAYRIAHPNEVSSPGITWTPPYPNGTIGRQDYTNQVLDRMDRIYFNDSDIQCIESSVVTGREGNGEIKFDCDWPSDHWAVHCILKIK